MSEKQTNALYGVEPGLSKSQQIKTFHRWVTMLLQIHMSEPLHCLLALDPLVLAVAAQTNLGDKLSQPRVAEQQPASGSDAVSFVLKLLRFQFTEITKSGQENEKRL